MGAPGPDLSTKTDRELRRLRRWDDVGVVVFAPVLVAGVVLWVVHPVPGWAGDWLVLVVLMTGGLNVGISLYGHWLIRRETALRWHERELWVRHEAEALVITPTPSVALARLRAKPPAA